MEYVYQHALFFRKPTRPSLPLRVFRKPTSPPLPLREGPPHLFESLLVNSLYDPFGSPCRGQKPFPKIIFESLRLPFQRELHLFPQAPSSSEGGGCNRSSSELKPLCYMVGGPSEVCARFFVRDESHGHGVADFS